MAKITKITKKQVTDYRKLTKLRAIICKGLKFVNEKIAAMEAKFHDSAKEHGPQIVDGFIAEIAKTSGRTGVEYKAAYMEAYKLLTPANRKKMDAFLPTVTTAPIQREYVAISDAQQSFFEGVLKTQDAAAIAQQIEEGLDITPFN